jgi:hypothetical protein
MRKSPTHLALLALAVTAVGCSVAARDANNYAQDTQKVLETRNGAIKTCYDQLLKADPNIAGTVTVKFTVKTETGDLADIKVDAAGTTAPEALSQCVVTSIQGLKLAPADEQEGLATYTWNFQVGAAPSLPTPAAVPAVAASPAPAAAPPPAVPAAAAPPAAAPPPAAPAAAPAASSTAKIGASGLIGPTRAPK